MEEPRFLSGKLLLAMPGMADPRFERAVIALCVHDENGAVGIGIGHKRSGMRFRALLQQLDIDPGEAPDCAVHHGGPVEPGRGFVLHSTDWGGQDSLQVNGPDGTMFAMTGTIDVLKAIAQGKTATACSVLQDFINQVNAQRGKAIATATADAWLAMAEQLRTALGC